jgi:CBS-domain-containing membrane protein
MKRNVVSILATATIGDAATLYAEKHIDTLPVIDEDRKLVGVLYMRDLLYLVMPSFIDLLDDFDFVREVFGFSEDFRPSATMEAWPVSEVMDKAVSVSARSGLMRTFAMLDHHDIYDMPIVDDDSRLVGLTPVPFLIAEALLFNTGGVGEGCRADYTAGPAKTLDDPIAARKVLIVLGIAVLFSLSITSFTLAQHMSP